MRLDVKVGISLRYDVTKFIQELIFFVLEPIVTTLFVLEATVLVWTHVSDSLNIFVVDKLPARTANNLLLLPGLRPVAIHIRW